METPAEDRQRRLNAILEEQGWLVVAWDGLGEPVRVGAVFHGPTDDGLGNATPGPLMVLGPATGEEFLEQGRRLVGRVTFDNAMLVAQGGHEFFRVTAE